MRVGEESRWQTMAELRDWLCAWCTPNIAAEARRSAAKCHPENAEKVQMRGTVLSGKEGLDLEMISLHVLIENSAFLSLQTIAANERSRHSHHPCLQHWSPARGGPSLTG
ncbi:hypothetical protein DPSP01_011618 [Paraphaeosphaeria sporulosa]